MDLVSIVVVSYNSSEFILDTLESIKNQTYRNIELIIADDYSTDCTVDIVENWIKDNSAYFYNCNFVKASKNTGISANLNRGIRASSGRYIKLIAADDLLKPICIEKMHEYATRNQISILFSDYEIFKVIDNKKVNLTEMFKIKKDYFNLTSKQQFNKLIVKNFLPAPTVFFDKKLYEDVNGYEESYSMLDDWPFWIKILRHGIKLSFLDYKLIEYRIHDKSLSHNKKSYNVKYYESIRDFYNIELKKEQLRRLKILSFLYYYIEIIYMKKVIENGNSSDNLKIYDKLIILVSPLHIYYRIKYRVGILLKSK